MGARGEVVQQEPGNLFSEVQTPAAAWLLGYVRTDAPGYREVELDGVLSVVASGDHRFDDFVTASQGVWNAYGGVSFNASEIGFPDRLGWLLGFGDARQVAYGSSKFIPPAGIPLMGATWTRVDSEADRRVIFDRHRRNQGYMWGAALVWRCKLTMHRWSLEALQTGWCLRGKVTLGCVGMLDTPISVSEPTGAITGYALGLDSVRWLDSIQQTAVVEMSIVTA